MLHHNDSKKNAYRQEPRNVPRSFCAPASEGLFYYHSTCAIRHIPLIADDKQCCLKLARGPLDVRHCTGRQADPGQVRTSDLILLLFCILTSPVPFTPRTSTRPRHHSLLKL